MFLTLNEYLLGARKLLNIYGYNCHKNDEDAIAFVASYMMKADETCNEELSCRNTWRYNQAKYAILKLRSKYRKQKRGLISLNKTIKRSSDRDICLQDIIPDNRKDRDGTIKEILQIASQKLSKMQLRCFSLYYVNGFTMDQIGHQLGITKQAVSLNIKVSIHKIKNECRNKIDYS